MKKYGVLAIFLCVTLVLGLSFAMAAGERLGKSGADKSLEKAKRVNYGSCVSAQSKIKNSCYKAEKETYKGCNANVREQHKNGGITNKSQIRNMNTDCRNAYKEKMNQCKLAFKANKTFCESWKCSSNKTYENGTCAPI